MSPRVVLRSTFTSPEFVDVLSIILSVVCAFNPKRTASAIIRVVIYLILDENNVFV